MAYINLNLANSVRDLATNINSMFNEIYQRLYTASAAKYVLASPTSGSGLASLRPIDTSDIPSPITSLECTTSGVISTGCTLTYVSNSSILGACLPIGSIYTAYNSANPNTYLGFGTWTAFGTGRCLVGYDSGQTEFDTLEETGGAKTHSLTSAEIPSHTHNFVSPSFGLNNFTDSSGAATMAVSGNNVWFTGTTTGSGAAHNNLQPYVVVYFWKRVS